MAVVAKPVELEVRRIALDNGLGIADEEIGGVVIRAVDERLHLDWAAVAQALREIPRDDNPHSGVAVVKRSG